MSTVDLNAPTLPAPPPLVKGQLVSVAFTTKSGHRYELPNVDGAQAQALAELFPDEWKTITLTNTVGASLTLPVSECHDLHIDGQRQWQRG